jgi:hypothetical protein
MQRVASRLFTDLNRTVGWYIPEAGPAQVPQVRDGARPAAEAAAHE